MTRASSRSFAKLRGSVATEVPSPQGRRRPRATRWRMPPAGEDVPPGDATGDCLPAERPAACGTDGCGNSPWPACASGLWTCPPVTAGSACATDAGEDGATAPDAGGPGLGVPCPVYSDASVPSRCLEGMLCIQDQASPAACTPTPASCGDDAGFVAMCLCIGAFTFALARVPLSPEVCRVGGWARRDLQCAQPVEGARGGVADYRAGARSPQNTDARRAPPAKRLHRSGGPLIPRRPRRTSIDYGTP